ncbi:unnamed protein product [Blepharisma stoltei]|uniref:RING-type domain-containing protein n=1 Tax=Blepharisma stoltei TaxID=1481888 RepID=A0AAU9IXS0_9CILI|nr:unnamed protein product [Blepharisma stoltei]
MMMMMMILSLEPNSMVLSEDHSIRPCGKCLSSRPVLIFSACCSFHPECINNSVELCPNCRSHALTLRTDPSHRERILNEEIRDP